MSTEDSPKAVSIEDIKLTASNDPIYMLLVKCINSGQSGDKQIKEAGYHHIWNELCVEENIILKGSKIVIPDAELFPGSGNKDVVG